MYSYEDSHGPTKIMYREMGAHAHFYTFDSTLGYPGEGPSTELEIIGWNCGGVRDEPSGKLNQLVFWITTRKNTHAYTIQEHHLSERQCRDVEMNLRHKGWEARFTPRDDDTASRGTAVIINVQKFGIGRDKIKFEGGENGTITTAEIRTPERKYHIASVYMPTADAERNATIDSLIAKKWITRDTILEADHNMFEDATIDTEGTNRYDPPGANKWFTHLAGLGLEDEERNALGRRQRVYTRFGNARKSRLDKFMMPVGRSYREGWQWKIKHDKNVTPFTSDHTPLVATLVIPNKQERGKPKNRINMDLIDERWFRDKIREARKDTYSRFDTAINGHGTVHTIWPLTAGPK